jgi:hypothetical protein
MSIPLYKVVDHLTDLCDTITLQDRSYPPTFNSHTMNGQLTRNNVYCHKLGVWDIIQTASFIIALVRLRYKIADPLILHTY